jgi:hypothetical protein
MKYKLSLESIFDYTQMSIMAGDLYLLDEDNIKSYLYRVEHRIAI